MSQIDLKNVILLDNGAYMIKAGDALQKEPQRYFNGVLRDRVSKTNVSISNKAIDDINSGKQKNHQIVHPQVRGLLQDSDLQSLIWQNVFKSIGSSDHSSQTLVMTVQPLLPTFVQERYAEMVFEDFGFEKLAMLTSHSALLQTLESKAPCHLVVDSGFSFTYGLPFFNGIPMKQAAVRIDVGGKLLTNLMTEMISHKDFNLQGEFEIVNQIKEATCFIARTKEEFNLQMEKCHGKTPECSDFVLPDYKSVHRGFVVKDHEKLDRNQSIVNLTKERFLCPEVLFSPSDIGINQGGIADMIREICYSRVPRSF